GDALPMGKQPTRQAQSRRTQSRQAQSRQMRRLPDPTGLPNPLEHSMELCADWQREPPKSQVITDAKTMPNAVHPITRLHLCQDPNCRSSTLRDQGTCPSEWPLAYDAYGPGQIGRAHV